MFSPQQDIEMGQQVSRDAEQQVQMLNDARVDNYLNNLGRTLASHTPGEQYPYHISASMTGPLMLSRCPADLFTSTAA
jgi:predicted Zn-dependent protease